MALAPRREAPNSDFCTTFSLIAIHMNAIYDAIVFRNLSTCVPDDDETTFTPASKAPRATASLQRILFQNHPTFTEYSEGSIHTGFLAFIINYQKELPDDQQLMDVPGCSLQCLGIQQRDLNIDLKDGSNLVSNLVDSSRFE